MIDKGIRSPEPDGPGARLWRILLSLAAPVQVEPEELISTPWSVEKLVVEFDEAYTAFVESFERLPSESQMMALQAVDTKLAAMVREKDASLWTARGYREDPTWHEVRTLADYAVGEFDWPRPLD
jgi:hypothetical protein